MRYYICVKSGGQSYNDQNELFSNAEYAIAYAGVLARELGVDKSLLGYSILAVDEVENANELFSVCGDYAPLAVSELIHPLIFRRRSFATVGTNFD